MILWAGALRGGEIFLLEASELVKIRNDGSFLKKDGHVAVPLMGRLKKETGERNLLIVLENKTKSRLNIRKWVDLFRGLLNSEGNDKDTRSALCNKDGYMMERWKLNGEFHAVLNKVQTSEDGIISADIIVDERFIVYRSFRRGATTWAKEQGVDEPTIEVNNRWRKWQNKQGSMPNLPMTKLYVEISQILTSKLRLSLSL